MSTAGKNMKVCVTCDYFSGCRKASGFNFVDFDSNQTGKCYRIFPQGIERKPMSNCPDWECWAALKRWNK